MMQGRSVVIDSLSIFHDYHSVFCLDGVVFAGAGTCPAGCSLSQSHDHDQSSIPILYGLL